VFFVSCRLFIVYTADYDDAGHVSKFVVLKLYFWSFCDYISTMFDVCHTFALLCCGLGRRSLRSVGTNRLTVPSTRLSTVGSRAFPVVGPQTWKNLPEDVTSADSLSTFRRLLKTHLFRKSFPDYMLDIN